jgi:hypothetical protein
MQGNKIMETGTSAIVREWGDEPVTMLLYNVENNITYVGSEACASPIGLPFEQVFRFDKDVFESLCTAFQQHEEGNLGEHLANLIADGFSLQ